MTPFEISKEFRLAWINRSGVPISENYLRQALSGRKNIPRETAEPLINAWNEIRKECEKTFPHLPQLRPWHINRKWRQIWPELAHQIDAPRQSADKPPALA